MSFIKIFPNIARPMLRPSALPNPVSKSVATIKTENQFPKAVFSTERSYSTFSENSDSLLRFFIGGVTAIVGGSVLFQAVKKEQEEKEFNYRMDRYFKLLDTYADVLGPDGNSEKGEIQIIRNRRKIREMEKKVGHPLGVVFENRFHIVLVDMVRFANGNEGVYLRVVWRQALHGISGAAMLTTVTVGGKEMILLQRIYRHATRSWELETIRGNGSGAENLKQLVGRELKEEAGAIETELKGESVEINPDSGLTTGEIHLVRAHLKLSNFDSRDLDDGEIGSSLHLVSREQLEEGLRRGYISVKIDGKRESMRIRDGFLLSLLGWESIQKKQAETTSQVKH